MIVQELKRGAEPAVVDELHDAVQLFELILQRRPRQHDGVTAPQLLDGFARLRFPVLDALSFIEHDQVRLPGIEFVEIAHGDFVVDKAIKRRLPILFAPLRRAPFDHLHRPPRELADLRLPLIFHRRRRHDEDALDAAFASQQLGGRERLHGFAESHVVAEDAAPAAGGKQGAAQLIGIERHFQ